MTFGSLFAGIGGFDLGLERAGMVCQWQVEIEPYAQAVLKKHWPNVRRWEDVRTFPPPEGEWGVDVICGGFPCQDISVAGKGAGLAGARSGLWHEFARIIGELRPRYVIVENVAALLTRGMDAVLGTLSSLGYDAEWHVIPASAVGAPHRRDRVWIIAYANDEGEPDVSVDDEPEDCLPEPAGCVVCYPNSEHFQGWSAAGLKRKTRPAAGRSWWADQSAIRRVVDGVPCRMDRLRGLGNAVVPQIVEIIGRAIVQREEAR